MEYMTYNFTISKNDQLIDTIRDYIELIRTGVNLTDDYLGIYPSVEKTENGKVLTFDIQVPVNPFDQSIRAKFLAEFIRRFNYDFKYSPELIKVSVSFD